MLNVNIKLKNPRSLEVLAMQETAKILNTVLYSAEDEILQDLKAVTGIFLRRSRFFRAVVNSDLSGEFGIPNGEEESRMTSIINKVVEEMSLLITPIKSSGSILSGGVRLGIGQDGWDNIMNLPAALIVTDKGEILEWMRWALIEGDRVIISDFDVEFGFGFGRSGVAHMVENTVQGWRVPSAYSGTLDDNWITREVNKNFSAYNRIIQNTFKRRLAQYLT